MTTQDNLVAAWTLLSHGVLEAIEYRDDMESLAAACPLLLRACTKACRSKSLWTRMLRVGRIWPHAVIRKGPPMPMYPSIPGMYTIIPSVFSECMKDDMQYFDVGAEYGDTGQIMCNNLSHGSPTYAAITFTCVCAGIWGDSELELDSIRVTDAKHITAGAVHWSQSFTKIDGRLEGNSLVFSDTPFKVHVASVRYASLNFSFDGDPGDAYIKIRRNPVEYDEKSCKVYVVKRGRVVAHYCTDAGTLNPTPHISSAFRCPKDLVQTKLWRQFNVQQIKEFLALDEVEFVMSLQDKEKW